MTPGKSCYINTSGLTERSTNPKLTEQTAFLQLRSVLVSDAEVPASKDLVAKTLETVLILNQVAFESCGRPWK